MSKLNAATRTRNALACASGKPVEAQVRAKVTAKFPDIGAKVKTAHTKAKSS